MSFLHNCLSKVTTWSRDSTHGTIYQHRSAAFLPPHESQQRMVQLVYPWREQAGRYWKYGQENQTCRSSLSKIFRREPVLVYQTILQDPPINKEKRNDEEHRKALWLKAHSSNFSLERSCPGLKFWEPPLSISSKTQNPGHFASEIDSKNFSKQRERTTF